MNDRQKAVIRAEGGRFASTDEAHRRCRGHLRHYWERFAEDDDWNVVGLFDALLEECGRCPWSVRRFCVADFLAVIGVNREQMLEHVVEMLGMCPRKDVQETKLGSIEDMVELIISKCGQCIYNRDCASDYLLLEVTPKKVWLTLFKILAGCRNADKTVGRDIPSP